jgi:hypothetical protein
MAHSVCYRARVQEAVERHTEGDEALRSGDRETLHCAEGDRGVEVSLAQTPSSWLYFLSLASAPSAVQVRSTCSHSCTNPLQFLLSTGDSKTRLQLDPLRSPSQLDGEQDIKNADKTYPSADETQVSGTSSDATVSLHPDSKAGARWCRECSAGPL